MAIHPLELVHLNYLCLEQGKGLDENVLVVTDHFTRYAHTYAQTTAKIPWNKFVVHYGLSEKILLNQGQNFESVGGWPLYADGNAKDTDQSITSAN